MARPLWYRITAWIGVLFVGPYYAVAIYAFIKKLNFIRDLNLVWASVMIVNLSCILSEQIFGVNKSDNLKIILCAYGSFLIFPILMLIRVLGFGKKRMWNHHKIQNKIKDFDKEKENEKVKGKEKGKEITENFVTSVKSPEKDKNKLQSPKNSTKIITPHKSTTKKYFLRSSTYTGQKVFEEVFFPTVANEHPDWEDKKIKQELIRRWDNLVDGAKKVCNE
ncbi:MAG: hypothetical protein EZS28_007866 [Streblomastix strix]|uniref:EXPERA domain-containing protein n=1 Tax=Streblomastix strix TaxID=222440 RepID=A0A5J4WP46_9EUKA|nr:MAG: hypothetical protein EZS28_007866 [Streblomastix strix]